MANYKRYKPKQHTFSDGYDKWQSSGNHRERASITDLKKPQMNTHNHGSPWRYKNVIGY